MQLLESVRTSLEEVKGHPLRSFFTLIGVILGTLAIVVVMSVLDGVGRAVWQGVEDLGMDGVLVLSQRKPTDAMMVADASAFAGTFTPITRNPNPDDNSGWRMGAFTSSPRYSRIHAMPSPFTI